MKLSNVTGAEVKGKGGCKVVVETWKMRWSVSARGRCQGGLLTSARILPFWDDFTFETDPITFSFVQREGASRVQFNTQDCYVHTLYVCLVSTQQPRHRLLLTRNACAKTLTSPSHTRTQTNFSASAADLAPNGSTP